jgi:hypothetical protein
MTHLTTATYNYCQVPSMFSKSLSRKRSIRQRVTLYISCGL